MKTGSDAPFFFRADSWFIVLALPEKQAVDSCRVGLEAWGVGLSLGWQGLWRAGATAAVLSDRGGLWVVYDLLFALAERVESQ